MEKKKKRRKKKEPSNSSKTAAMLDPKNRYVEKRKVKASAMMFVSYK